MNSFDLLLSPFSQPWHDLEAWLLKPALDRLVSEVQFVKCWIFDFKSFMLGNSKEHRRDFQDEGLFPNRVAKLVLLLIQSLLFGWRSWRQFPSTKWFVRCYLVLCGSETLKSLEVRGKREALRLDKLHFRPYVTDWVRLPVLSMQGCSQWMQQLTFSERCRISVSHGGCIWFFIKTTSKPICSVAIDQIARLTIFFIVHSATKWFSSHNSRFVCSVVTWPTQTICQASGQHF